MARFIFGGTYDGFSAWYDSDRNYNRRGSNDPVVKHLLDRGKIFLKGSDRLYKKGYSIQPVCSESAVGIFFHEIMLLSDFYGRAQGFMMASLFLPKDERLNGRVIRESLDRLVAQYETLANVGQAVVEVDWSFVDNEAEALNQQVELLAWDKIPSNNASQGSALVKGLSMDDVDRFFSYPHPLYRKLSCYEQVFLTEELLSPTSTDYIVLDKDEVDPTNPDVFIPRPSGYNILSWTADSMKMMDLVAACASNDGRFLCGRVSRPGYREGDAFINHEDVDNLNGRDEVKVTLPELKRMEASVTLQLADNENKNLELKATDFTIEWSCEDVKSKPSKQGETTFIFEGEQCGHLWTVTVHNSDYEKSNESIQVSDGITPILPITMEHKKLRIIKVSVPEAYKSSLKEEFAVYEAEKQSKIEEIKTKFEKYGLRVVVRPGLDFDEVIVTEWPEWEILANTPMGMIDDPSNPLKFKGSKEDFDKKIVTCKNYYVEKGYEFESQHGPNEVENDNRCILRFKEKTVPIPVQPDTTVTEDVTPEQDANIPVVTTVNTDSATTELKPEMASKPRTFYIRLDIASKDFPLFKNKTDVVEDDGAGSDTVVYDGRRHCLIWEGLSSECPDPSKLRLKGYGKYRFEFDNSSELQWSESPNGTRFKVNKYAKEEPKTFYIPLTDDGSPNFPLFKKYVTPDEAQQAINRLEQLAEGLDENDLDRACAKRVVDCLNGVEGKVNIQMAEYNLDGIPKKIPSKKVLHNFAKEAIDKKKHSYLVEGDDSVRYDRVHHCLTWEGLPSQRPDPKELKFKAYPKHHYEFANDPEHPLQWVDTPNGDRYKVNKINDKKDIYCLLDWLRTHLLIVVGIIALVVGLIKLVVSVDWGKTKENVQKENPIKHISILPSCSRVISQDQPPQNDEEGPKGQNGQEETDEDTEEELQDVEEESPGQNEIQQEETVQNTGNSGESVMDGLVLAARKVDTLNWNILMKSHKYPDNYSTYLKAMRTHIESINDSVQRLTVKTALIETDSHIFLAMKAMDESTSYEPKKKGTIKQNDQYYGNNSPFSYFLDCLDKDRQNYYISLWYPTTPSSNSGESSSSSGTSSTSRTTSPSIVTPSQNGQNEQGQGNVGTGSGTDGSTKAGTETQPQKEKIEVKNIDDLWSACNKWEHVMKYDDYIEFRCSTKDLKQNLINIINSIKNVINENNKDSYVGLYDSVDNENITVGGKFEKLIKELQSSNTIQ